MRTASRVLVPLVLLAFLWGVLTIVLVPVESGDAYPRYSSLRPDAMGAKVLYESLRAMPGIEAEQNFRRLEALPRRPAPTVFVLGGFAPGWYFTEERTVKEWESMAGAGARLVFVFQPSIPALKGNFDVFKKDKKDPEKKAVQPAVFTRWGIDVKLREIPARERAQYSRMPRESAVYFAADPTWTVSERARDGLAIQVEKRMGAGSIVVATQMFRLSNEGLREHVDATWIASLIGGNTRVVFDEYHHSVQDNGSIGTMLRRYRLQGAVVVLLIIGLLFIWRNGSSLLPARPATLGAPVAGWDAQQGLTALFERSIPSDQLAAVCFEEWRKSAALRPSLPAARSKQVRDAATSGEAREAPVAAYREIHRILTADTK